jgi:hypothetical protein
VQTFLPSAKFRALGKDLLCRMPHSAKTWHSAKVVLAFGKARHSAKIEGGQTASSAVLFAECLPFGTRKVIILPSVKPRHSAKYFFLFFGTNFFEALLRYHKQHVKIWHIFIALWYISLFYFVLLNFFG